MIIIIICKRYTVAVLLTLTSPVSHHVLIKREGVVTSGPAVVFMLSIAPLVFIKPGECRTLVIA